MMSPAARARRERVDRLLVDRGLAPSRTQAQALVLAGRVTSDGTRLDKPGTRLPADAPLQVAPGARYVSRGGHKLAGALPALGLEVTGREALDVGASTGGFTDALLEAGAGRVIALDVGKGQLDWNLRNDPRVSVLEGINARYLEPSSLPFTPDLAVVDVSFISIELILPPVMRCLSGRGDVVALVKPQFEVGRGKVGPGGIVRDPALHHEVLRRITDFVLNRGWAVRGLARSPLEGAEGNVEFFLLASRVGKGMDGEAVSEAIHRVVSSASREDEP